MIYGHFSHPKDKNHKIAIAPFFEPNTSFFFKIYTLNKDHQVKVSSSLHIKSFLKENS